MLRMTFPKWKGVGLNIVEWGLCVVLREELCLCLSGCLFGMDWYRDQKRSEIAMLGLKMTKVGSGQIRISLKCVMCIMIL